MSSLIYSSIPMANIPCSAHLFPHAVKCSKNLKQTVLACLAPPKVSTKARFMNLHRLVEWANLLLQHSPRGNAAAGSILAKLRANLDQLPECRAFITLFLRDALPLLACRRFSRKAGSAKKLMVYAKN